MFGNNALKEISEGLEDIVDLFKKPNDFHSRAPYFFHVMGRGFSVDHIENYPYKCGFSINDCQKIKLKNIEKITDLISNTGSPIFDKGIKDNLVAKNILNLYATVIPEINDLWLDIIKGQDIEKQLKSFKDRDIGEYVKHITGYTPSNFGNSKEEIVRFFIEKTFKHLAN